MPGILATVLRCTLALALVVNGGVGAFPVHADTPAGTGGDSGSAHEMPCHGDDEAAADGAPAPQGKAADCCGSQCTCDCVLGSVLTTSAPRIALDLPVRMIPDLAAGPFVATAIPRLLRPPIA